MVLEDDGRPGGGDEGIVLEDGFFIGYGLFRGRDHDGGSAEGHRLADERHSGGGAGVAAADDDRELAGGGLDGGADEGGAFGVGEAVRFAEDAEEGDGGGSGFGGEFDEPGEGREVEGFVVAEGCGEDRDDGLGQSRDSTHDLSEYSSACSASGMI